MLQLIKFYFQTGFLIVQIGGYLITLLTNGLFWFDFNIYFISFHPWNMRIIYCILYIAMPGRAYINNSILFFFLANSWSHVRSVIININNPNQLFTQTHNPTKTMAMKRKWKVMYINNKEEYKYIFCNKFNNPQLNSQIELNFFFLKLVDCVFGLGVLYICRKQIWISITFFWGCQIFSSIWIWECGCERVKNLKQKMLIFG